MTKYFVSALVVIGSMFARLPNAVADYSVPWLLPVEQTQKTVFDYLKEKTGEEVNLPVYPKNSVLQWSQAQLADAPQEKALYGVIYKHLLVARQIIDDTIQLKDREAGAQQKRRAMQLADIAASQADTNLKDRWLVARIREAFLLPNLDAARSEGWEVLSRAKIVERVSIDYREAGENDKEMASLKLLVQVADTRNLADSARVRLARSYAAKQDYERAIAYLEIIRNPSVIPAAEKLIPQYQQLLREKENAAQTSK